MKIDNDHDQVNLVIVVIVSVFLVAAPKSCIKRQKRIALDMPWLMVNCLVNVYLLVEQNKYFTSFERGTFFNGCSG